MKKVISMILALLMVFSVCGSAIAADLPSGAFAPSYDDANATSNTVELYEDLNLELAEESIVLLENNGVLPLADGTKITYVEAGSHRLSGSGSGGTSASADATIDPDEGIDEHADLELVNLVESSGGGGGFPGGPGGPGGEFPGGEFPGGPMPAATLAAETTNSFSDFDMEAAEEYAATSDVAIMWISRQPGEGNDRSATKGDWYLSDDEEEALEYLTAAFEDVIVCLNLPSIDMAWVDEYDVDAVIMYGYAGAQGGRALANILAGDVNPSAKLVDTLASLESYASNPNFDTFALGVEYFTMENDSTRHFPWWLDTPNPAYGYLNGEWIRPYDEYYFTKYEEGIYNGYRYFETFEEIVADYNETVSEDEQVPFEVYYDFGYGLSYTDFDVEIVDYALPTEIPTVDNDQTITIKAKVTNVGDYAGKEVVEIYYGGPDGILENPTVELVAYDKTEILEPGESQIVEITFDAYDMSDWYEEIASYILMEGQWNIYVGNSIDNAYNECITWTCLADEYTVVAEGSNLAGPAQEGGTYDQYLEAYPEIELIEMSKYDYANTKPDGAEGVRKNDTEISDSRIGSNSTDRNIFDGVVNGTMGQGYLAPDGTYDFQSYYSNLKNITQEAVAEAAAEMNNEAEYVLLDVYLGNCTMDQFLDQMTEIELCAFVMGAGRVGMSFTDETSNGDGPQGIKRLGIPTYSVSDGPNRVGGKATTTAWSCGTTRAQSWNEDLILRVGLACGYEAIAGSTEINLAPGMNIHRHPLCGRNYEYYSEDPVITGTMGAAFVRGFQLSGNGVTLKHYAMNQMEGENNDRWNKLDSVASERAMREIYLKGFEIVCKTSNPLGIMTAYQMINGKYAAGAGELVGILREEWGFTGLSMTDWSGDWGAVLYDLNSEATDLLMPANFGMLTYLYTSLQICQEENRGLSYQEAGHDFDVGLTIDIETMERAAESQLNTLMKMRVFYDYYAEELAELGYDSYEELPTAYELPEKQFEAETGAVITAGSATVGYGEEAAIDVSISDNEDGISSVRIMIDCEIPESAITSDYELEYNKDKGYVVVYTADGSLVEGDVVLFTINYDIDEIYADGDYVMSLDVVDSTGADDAVVTLTTKNGVLTIANAYPAGDVNQDMMVTNADVIALARYLVELVEFNEQQLELADVDADDEVDNADLIKLARAIVNA